MDSDTECPDIDRCSPRDSRGTMMFTHMDIKMSIQRKITVLAAVWLAIVLALLIGLGDRVGACPFCDVTQQTLSEELTGADAAVIAIRTEVTASASAGESEISPAEQTDPFEADNASPYKGTKFRVVEVLKGDLEPGDEIETVYFGEDPADKLFFITGVQGDKMEWGTPLPMTTQGVDYVKQLLQLARSGPERLRFFLAYLENSDPLLAQDTYDEFARAPYQDLIDIKDALDREQLVKWITDSQIGPTRRRLYLTMLGVCGTRDDAEMLQELLSYDYESLRPGLSALIGLMNIGGSALGAPLVDELVHADVRAKQQCLDALIAAYLKLKGPEGLPLIEERFLKNPAADYTQRYSTIMALRFHGEESSEISRHRLVQSLRLLLDNDEIADQVIPDLTRWEDWGIMDQLVEKFKASDEDGWIRQPVISYLLTAADQPGEVGEKAIAAVAELEEMDPEAVKRARSYLEFGLMGRGSAVKSASADESNRTRSTAQAKVDQPQTAQVQAAQPKEEPKEVAAVQRTKKPISNPMDSTTVLAAPSTTTIVVIPLVIGLVLMGLFGLMLRSGHTSPHRAPTT